MNITKQLSREEMKKIKGGEWTSCSCYSGVGGENYGDVTCSEGMSYQTCCNAAYQSQGNTTYVEYEAVEEPHFSEN